VINLDANTVVRLQLWDIAGAFLAVHSTALLSKTLVLWITLWGAVDLPVHV
jgi:hypothetical protein